MMVGGKIVLEADERQELERRTRATTIAVRDRQRAEIILLRAGRGRKPSLPPEAVRVVLEKAVTPPATLARWSCRTMAREAGISQASVQRLWAANAIKPHLLRTFKLSKDKQFETKIRRKKRWSCAAMKNRSAKPWSGPSPACRLGSVTSKRGRTTTSGMAR